MGKRFRIGQLLSCTAFTAFFVLASPTLGQPSPTNATLSPISVVLSRGETIWGKCEAALALGQLPGGVTVNACTTRTLELNGIMDDRAIPAETRITLELLVPSVETSTLSAALATAENTIVKLRQTVGTLQAELQKARVTTTGQSSPSEAGVAPTSNRFLWAAVIFSLVFILVAFVVGRRTRAKGEDPDTKETIKSLKDQIHSLECDRFDLEREIARKGGTSEDVLPLETPMPNKKTPSTIFAIVNKDYVGGDVPKEKRTLEIKYWLNDAGTMVHASLPWVDHMGYNPLKIRRLCIDSAEKLGEALGITINKHELILTRNKSISTEHVFETILPTAAQLLARHKNTITVAA